jgi:chemotaxis protein CheX
MKSHHINPCIEATVDTYKTMLDITPYRNGKLEVKTGVFPVSQCMGVIGFTGKVRGAMLIGMSEEVACKTISSFLDKEILTIDADVLDGIGEIINIIARGASAKLADYRIGLGIPTVLVGKVGKEQKMFSGIESPWIIIPLITDESGEFEFAITMEET